MIARYIDFRPGDCTADEARLGDYGVSVTAIIYYLQGENEDINTVAAAYEIPIEAVRAANAYYKRHRAVIDARITLNVAAWSG